MWFDIGLIFFLVLVMVLVLSSISLGAPYVPTHRHKVRKLVELVKETGAASVIDLGSGDGRIVAELAKAGISAQGYETNPVLVAVSRNKIRKLGLANSTKIQWGNMWKSDLSTVDAVTVFGITKIMSRLEKKLLAELKPGAWVFSYVFQFPNWQPEKIVDSIYIYKKE